LFLIEHYYVPLSDIRLGCSCHNSLSPTIGIKSNANVTFKHSLELTLSAQLFGPWLLFELALSKTKGDFFFKLKTVSYCQNFQNKKKKQKKQKFNQLHFCTQYKLYLFNRMQMQKYKLTIPNLTMKQENLDEKDVEKRNPCFEIDPA
jgi:hypothetical protein